MGIDGGVQGMWNYLGYIVHDYTGQLIGWANGLSDIFRGI